MQKERLERLEAELKEAEELKKLMKISRGEFVCMCVFVRVYVYTGWNSQKGTPSKGVRTIFGSRPATAMNSCTSSYSVLECASLIPNLHDDCISPLEEM